MIQLETARLVLRQFQADDWQALREMILQYQATPLALYDERWPNSPEEIQRVTAWFAAGRAYRAVCLKESGRLIGFVALNDESRNGRRQYNLGYLFNADYHGQGYAAEACRAALDDAFDRLGADAVVTGTASVNIASRRLLERLGFVKTRESISSFQTAPDGQPIEFLGYSYELTRERRILVSS